MTFFIYKSSNYLKRSNGKNIPIYTMRQRFRCCLDFLTMIFTRISLNVNKTRDHGFCCGFHQRYLRSCGEIEYQNEMQTEEGETNPRATCGEN